MARNPFPAAMKIRVKGVYEKRKPLADGRNAVHHYHRKSGARVMAAPGTVAFLVEVERLNGGRASVMAVPNSVKDLFRLKKASGHFRNLADRTKSEYIRALDEIEPIIGKFQVKDVRRAHVTMIRDKLAVDRPGWANAVVRVFSAALTFAWKDREWIDSSPCQKMALPEASLWDTRSATWRSIPGRRRHPWPVSKVLEALASADPEIRCRTAPPANRCGGMT